MKFASRTPATALGCLAAALMMLGGPAPAAKPEAKIESPADHVQFILTPYVWGSSVDGRVTVDERSADFDLPIDESIKYLTLGGMLGAEARQGRWGLLFDGVYMDLEDDMNTPGPFFEHLDVTLQQAWLDLGLAYRIFENDRGWVDILAGGRYNYYSTELDFDPDFAAVDMISEDIVDHTAATVRGAVENAVNGEADEIAEELAAQAGDIADEAHDKVVQDVHVRVDVNQVHRIIQDAGNRISEGLDDRGTQRTLADTSKVAFSGRMEDRIQAKVAAIDVRDEAIQLAAAVRRALAERVEKAIADAGMAIHGDAEAIRKTIEDAVDAGYAELKREASAGSRQALDQAEKALESKIDAGLQKAADTDVSESTDWVDPYVGFRTRWLLTQRLYAGLRADIGGFGIGSACELVWQLFGGLGYQCTENMAVEAGWRYLNMDYESGDLELDMAYSGATLGLAIDL